jgi:hypothetical protein
MKASFKAKPYKNHIIVTKNDERIRRNGSFSVLFVFITSETEANGEPQKTSDDIHARVPASVFGSSRDWPIM